MKRLWLGLICLTLSLTAAEYQFSTYSDNWAWWSNGKQFPQLPEGVMVDLAFGVLTPSGEIDPRYPINPSQKYDPVKGIPPTPPGCSGLGIGGWNDSISGGGLYIVMHSTDPKLVTTAAMSVVNAAVKYKYGRILIDYEDYSGLDLDLVKNNFMAFLTQIATQAHKEKIDVVMTISPDPAHQNYYDLGQLASIIDLFQVMTYDYARGLTKVEANASIMQTKTYLDQILKTVKDPTKIAVGVPFYALQFEIAANTPCATVQKELVAGTLSANQQEVISNDVLLKELSGNWSSPGGDWIVLQDGEKIPNYYYYSQHYGYVTSAMNPAAMNDFAKMMKQYFPKITQFFSWEAQNDMSGEMMRTLISAMNAKANDPT